MARVNHRFWVEVRSSESAEWERIPDRTIHGVGLEENTDEAAAAAALEHAEARFPDHQVRVVPYQGAP